MDKKEIEYIIYFMLDESKNVLYIGKTTSFKNRMSQHFNNFELKNNEWKYDVKYIKVYYINNEIDLAIYEIYFINKFKPKYNREFMFTDSKSTIVLNEKLISYEINIKDVCEIYSMSDIKIDFSEYDIMKLKNINIVDEKYSKFDKLNYNEIKNNLIELKKLLYNVNKNILDSKSKNSSIKIVYVDFVNKLKNNGMGRSIYTHTQHNKSDVENLFYVGYIEFKQSDSSLYNLKLLLDYINEYNIEKLKNIFIPSRRMRELFIKFLDNEINIIDK